jgi:hypothetical protein
MKICQTLLSLELGFDGGNGEEKEVLTSIVMVIGIYRLSKNVEGGRELGSC